MVNIVLENGTVIGCCEDLCNVTELLLNTKPWSDFIALAESENTGVIINTDKILYISGKFNDTEDDKVDGSPYSEDIIVD